MKILWLLPLFIYFGLSLDPDVDGPPQEPEGPGGAAYVCDSVIFSDFAAEPDGYWLFEPASPRPDSAQVIVFNHGYGAYNPMIYGAWIRHLVRRGNIVIFPRYQKNLFTPNPRHFPENVAKAIRQALVELDTGEHVRPVADPLVMVGHSYGGTVAAYLGIHFAEFDIPQPKAIMMVSPGTGFFKGARLEDYANMPVDTRLIIVVSDDDQVVGDQLGKLVFETAVNTPNRNLIRQYPDDHGEPEITAGHNQAYALYTAFDNGMHNFSYQRALRIASTDAVDHHGYWKLLDALIDCTSRGDNCNFALGNTPEQRSLGNWSDGTPVREFEVTLPADTSTAMD